MLHKREHCFPNNHVPFLVVRRNLVNFFFFFFSGPVSKTRGNAIPMTNRLSCSASCSTRVAAAERIEFSLPGNRVGLKTTAPPSLPCGFLLAALGRNEGC